MADMIELRGVGRRFGDKTALQPTNLSFLANTRTALIGPSGCGKSTLLRLIVALLTPTEGEVLYEGIRVTPSSALKIRRKTGYVIQDGGLFPHISARSNVCILAQHIGWERSQMAARVAELAELVKLEPSMLDRYPAELSGGQRQRVSLMRALMLDPDVLLLDEPLAALDPMVRNQLQRDLKELFERLGKTVVLVTHDMGEAAYLAERIVLMRDGRVVQDGTLEDFQEHPVDAFVSDFLTSQRTLVKL